MYVWMDHLADVGKVNIEHKLNTGKEKRIGKYFCDGFDSENNVVYEMDGCFFHGHRCHLTENAWKSRPKLMEKREEKNKGKRTIFKNKWLQSGKNKGMRLRQTFKTLFKL